MVYIGGLDPMIIERHAGIVLRSGFLALGEGGDERKVRGRKGLCGHGTTGPWAEEGSERFQMLH